MSRRRNPESDDALELFLDAISNAFGGVVFIAIVVVILLQFSTATPVQTEVLADPALVVSQLTAEELEAEIATLEALVAEQGATDDTGTRPEPRPPRDTDVLEQELAELREVLQETRRAVQVLESERRQEAEQLALLHEQLLEVQEQVEATPQPPTEHRRVGRFRQTDKREVPVMVHDGGRLLPVLGAGGGIDTASLVVDAASQSARPRPGAGVWVTDDAAGRRQVAVFLGGRDPARDFIAIAVWPDSFEAATRLRDAAIEMGFDYGLTPVPTGAGVPFNAAAGVQ